MDLAILLLLLLGVPHLLLLAMVVLGMLRRPSDAETPREPAHWPSVSVILPAHDEEERLPGTLASLLAQRYPGAHEFVVVDDRSSDRTPAILAELGARDPRLRVVRIERPSKRHAPKVHAVQRGIEASRGEILVTTDADCSYPDGWLRTLVGYLREDVVMVSGYVETDLLPRTGAVAWFEGADWFSLMLTSRSLLRFGWSFASSANNQAYRRTAFRAAGGFGAAARAPSGDEDLLAQRLGRRSGGRVVFGAEPPVRVRTRPMPGLRAFLRQRRRWVSRYQHVVQYHPAFIVGLSVLGFESIALSAALVASPFAPSLAPWALGLWGAQTAVHVLGMAIGARQLGRPAFGGLRATPWALLHPFFIAYLVIASAVRPAAWSAGAARYRRRILRRHLRQLRRRWLAR